MSLDTVCDTIHKLQLFRRVIICTVFALTFWVYAETFDILQDAEINVNTAAVIAALLSPVSLLLSSMIKTYAQNKYRDGEQ